MGKVQKMIDYAVKVARDDSRGYSQARRWPSQGTDFDCSSLMYESAHQAGYNVPASGTRYTGTMVEHFKAAGFKVVPFDGNLADLDAGDILVNVVHHTEMYIGNGQFVGAHGAEDGGIDGKPGDQTGDEISIVPAYVYWAGWDYVLVPPAEASTAKATAATKGLDGAYKVVASPFVHVRDKASTVNGAIKGQAKTGAKLQLANVKENSAGNTWGKVASGTHKGRYVCVKFKGSTLLKKA